MKAKFSFVLLAFLPVISVLVNPKILWVYHLALLMVILLEEGLIIKTKCYSFLGFLGIPLVWALFFSIDNSFYLITQSLFYLGTPLVFTFIGIQLSRIITPNLVIRYLVYSGTVGGVYYTLLSFYSLGLKVLINPYAMRELVFWVSITNVIALITLLFSEKFGIVIIKSKKRKFLIVAINLLALYLTASRTYYVSFFIFLFIFLYNYKKIYVIILGVIIVIFLSFIMTSNINNKFVDKIKSVGTETSTGNYDSEADINTKYRGFETYQALKTYNSGTPLNLFLGHGLAKQVDLKTYVNLGGSYFRLIPALHNGYVYLLIKVGALGLFFYLVFFIKVIRLKIKNKILHFTSMILAGSIVSLMFSNFVVATFFTTEMSILWVLFGVYIVHIEKEVKHARLDILRKEIIINTNNKAVMSL